MLAAIELDDHATFDAGEVGDVVADCALSPEFESAETAAAKDHPKATLGVRRLGAEGTGVVRVNVAEWAWHAARFVSDCGVAEAARSPSSALRAPSPRLRGEKKKKQPR